MTTSGRFDFRDGAGCNCELCPVVYAKLAHKLTDIDLDCTFANTDASADATSRKLRNGLSASTGIELLVARTRPAAARRRRPAPCPRPHFRRLAHVKEQNVSLTARF